MQSEERNMEGNVMNADVPFAPFWAPSFTGKTRQSLNVN